MGGTASPRTHLQKPQDIFLSTWSRYNNIYKLYSESMPTGVYHDVAFINDIARDIIARHDAHEIIWYPVDLICAYSGTYFESFIPPDDNWRDVDTSQPLELLARMLKEGEPSNLVMSYVEPINDSLPAIFVFRGQYKRWYQIFRRHSYALILAFSHDGDRLLGQYQVLDLKPNFVYNPMTKFPMHYFSEILFQDDIEPWSKHLLRLQKEIIPPTQSARDSLFQWFLTGPHTLTTEQYYKPKTGAVLGYPENWISLTEAHKDRFLKDALHPVRWRVKAAEVKANPYFLSYDYFFTLESRENQSEQISIMFRLTYDSFENVQMVQQLARRMMDE